jgi:hypothetical protein
MNNEARRKSKMITQVGIIVEGMPASIFGEVILVR